MKNVILRKIKILSVGVAVLILVFLLCSCSDNKNASEDPGDNGNSQTGNLSGNYENKPVDVLSHTFLSRYAFPVVEDEDFVWFVKSDGIYKKDKKDGSVSCFYSDNGVSALTLYENEIFFTSDDGSKIKKISRNGGEADEIFDVYIYDDFGSSLSTVRDYIIYGGKIYVTSPLEVYSVDIESGEYEKLGIDVSDMQIYDTGDIFYIPHGSRTFSIYALNPETGDNRLIRGNDISYPESNLIKAFIITDEGTYTLERNPDRIAYYGGDGYFSVVDEGIFSKIFIWDGKLFGLKCSENEDKTSSLICYGGENKSTVAELPDCGDYGILICDGFVYYTTSSSGNREINTVALSEQ